MGRLWVGSLSEEYDQYLAFYLPALQKHLEEKGWLKSYVQHLFDEAADSHALNNLLAKRIKKYAPWIRIIDAVSTDKVLESVDIMVPLYGAGSTRKAAAERERVEETELWFYTCIAGSPLNRSIEQPLTHPRLQHWANVRTKTTGYPLDRYIEKTAGVSIPDGHLLDTDAYIARLRQGPDYVRQFEERIPRQ